MSMTEAVIQGILQGLTEFLPISSSGHLSLFQYFTGQNGETGIMFSIFLHMGTLLAVFLAFYKTIFGLIAEFFLMIGDIFKGKFSLKNAPPRRRMVLLLIVSLIPMAASLFLLDMFNRVSTDNDIIVEGVCFLITSVLLFFSDQCDGEKNEKNMRYRDAVIVGSVQALAPLPGLSRSGSTISVGLLTGLDRKFAVAFSFIMGIPPVLAANLMELKKVSGEGLGVSTSVLAMGVLAAMVFGLLAIKLVGLLVKSEKFKIFAWYTMILGILTISIGIFERLNDHMIQSIIISLLESF